MRAAVIGGGSWGTALASVLGQNGHDTVVWAHDKEVAHALTEKHHNPKYLPGLQLSERVRGTHALAEALAGAELVGAGNPSPFTRQGMREALPFLPRPTPVARAAQAIGATT